jgi:hypothetical protein
MSLAREVVKDLAVEHGVCIRPVQLRRTNLDTGAVEQVFVPCGHTLASVCPACAQRAKTLRAAQCREGWHLEAEPVIDPDPATADQKWWVEKRAEAQVMRDQADAADQDIADLDELNNELDQEITAAGMRGNVLPARPQRRHRTTRRRQDAAPLPRRKIAARTIGKTYITPDISTVRFEGDHLPVWDARAGTYLDPATGEVPPTWDDALDAIGDQDEPLHVARFGERFDVQGVLAGSKDAGRCIGYLTKYLTKQVADCHQATTDAQRAHVERLAEALRYEPCSPRCANWLRYGIQPKDSRPGLIPGACKGKAHRREYLGYAGRRVLVSRKWSGKTLADQRADRKNWLLATLGVQAIDPARYAWEAVTPGDPDHIEHARRLLHVVADRQRWQASLAEARRRAGIELASDLSATGRAA